MRPLLLVFVLTTATAARCAPALEQLQTATPPVFRSGHTLIPLSRRAGTMCSRNQPSL